MLNMQLKLKSKYNKSQFQATQLLEKETLIFHIFPTVAD